MKEQQQPSSRQVLKRNQSPIKQKSNSLNSTGGMQMNASTAQQLQPLSPTV
jgi:hypothetical protein